MKIPMEKHGDSKNPHNLGIALISVLLCIYVFLVMPIGYISTTLVLTSVIFTGLFFLYAYVYVVYFGDLRRTLLLCTTFSVLVVFFASLVILYFINPSLHVLFSEFYQFYLPTIVIYFPVFFSVSLGFSILKYQSFGKNSMRVSFCFFIAAALLIPIIFYFTIPKIYITPNDEAFLTIHAISAVLSGNNPYTMNLSSAELSSFLNVNKSLLLPTVTVKNEVIGFMDYPAMYFLPLLPIYLISQFSTYNTSSIFLIFSAGIFGFVLLFSISYVIDKEFLKRPNYLVYMTAIFVLGISPSTTNYLMLAILLIAYYKIDSKYLFAFLGLAISTQELLWLPVLLFLVYIFNNKGFKFGSMTTLATIAVFLILNGYFIALSPSAFFRDIFAPLTNQLFPEHSAAFAQPLLIFYPIPLSAYSVLFYTAIAISVVIFTYTNRKQLIGPLSLFCMLFLFHSIGAYYFFFTSFLVITLFIGYGSKTKKSLLLKKIPKRKAKYLTLALITLITIFAISYVVTQHTVYLEKMNMGVSEGNLTATSKNVTYSATLNYNFTAPTALYIYAYGFDRGNSASPQLYGLIGRTILQNSTEHVIYNYTNYTSILNVNKLTVYGKGNKTFTLVIQDPNITYLNCVIYTNNLIYYCPGASIPH